MRHRSSNTGMWSWPWFRGSISRAFGPSLEARRVACSKCSHIAVPALDGLADRRCGDLVGDLDVPDLAFALRGEIGEQFWDDRHIANLVTAQAEAARDAFERGPAEDGPAIVDAV